MTQPNLQQNVDLQEVQKFTDLANEWWDKSGAFATLHQINWAADASAKGLQQSAGIMVNYLYELDKVEQQHEAFSQKTVVSSRQMQRW